MTAASRNRVARERAEQDRRGVIIEALSDGVRLKRWEDHAKQIEEEGEELLLLTQFLQGTRAPFIPEGWRLIWYWATEGAGEAVPSTIRPTMLPPGTITYPFERGGGAVLALGRWGEVDPTWLKGQWGPALVEGEGTGTFSLALEGQEGGGITITNVREVLYTPEGRPWLPESKAEVEQFILESLAETPVDSDGLSALAEVVEGMPLRTRFGLSL